MRQPRRVNPSPGARGEQGSAAWRAFYAGSERAARPRECFFDERRLLGALPVGRLEWVAVEVRGLEFESNGLCQAELANPSGECRATFDPACFDASQLPVSVLGALDELSPVATAPGGLLPFAVGTVVELTGAAVVAHPGDQPYLLVSPACLHRVYKP